MKMLADSFRLLVVLWLVVSGNGENIKSFYRKYYRGSHQMASSSLMERDIQEGVKRRLGHFGLFTINDLGIQFKSDLKQWREGIYPRGYEHSIDDKLLSLHHDSSPARESPLTAKWLPVQCSTMGYNLRKVRKLYGGNPSNTVLEMAEKNKDSADTHYAYKLFGKADDFAGELNFFTFSSHPNILKAICVERDKNIPQRPGLVFELVKGIDAVQYAKRPTTTVQDLKVFAGQLLSALIHVHWWGFVHADLKPENVMVTEDGREAILLDFGFALPLPYFKKNRGNPTIIAPELVDLVSGSVDEAIDMWAYGSTLAALFAYKYLPAYGGEAYKDSESSSKILSRDPSLSASVGSFEESKRSNNKKAVSIKRKRKNEKTGKKKRMGKNKMERRYVIAKIDKSGRRYKLGRIPKEFPPDLAYLLFLLTNSDPSLRRFNTKEAIDHLINLPFFKGIKVDLPW